MKVLFAVSNDKMSETIVKQYQKDYKQIISFKNVYYFNAILKELQKDKTYDRVVISEDLEQYSNTDYEQMDKFMFDKLDSITDEASNMNGEDIPILLICSERRTKSEPILVKLFGIGIYNAIIGNDRSVNEVCRLINRPRSKKEAKQYYKIDSKDVTYSDDENEDDVSELELQNILAHYKRIANDEDKYVESFDSIASQYNDKQLKIISNCLPLNVRAVLEERSPKYQEINSYNNKISDFTRVAKTEKPTTSEILLKNPKRKELTEPVVVPSVIDASKRKKITGKVSQQLQQEIKLKPVEPEVKPIEELKLEEEPYIEEQNKEPEIEELPMLEELEPIVQEQEPENLPEVEQEVEPIVEEPVVEETVKRKRGRPRKIVEEPVAQAPKRKRGRPRKNPEPEETVILPEEPAEGLPMVEPEQEENVLPGFDEEFENNVLPGFDEEPEEENTLPGFEEKTEPASNNDEEENVLPGFENDDIEDEYTNVLQNLKDENEKDSYAPAPKKEEIYYDELDMDSLLTGNQKLVAFVGTSKNGTSFLVNNVAELLSSNGIDTAILDLTNNRNAYYIYTKNEDNLREQSNHIMSNLINGSANGIQEHRNLTIYTSPFEKDEELENVEPIIETLMKNHTVVLMDCDFTTPMRYFKYAQEIYLVQSMDILTIQPLTAFLRQLSDKGMYEAEKVRVILNKFMRTREISEEILIGGISIYNDAGMTVRKELFNRKTVPYMTIPFELKTYLRYLDGLVTCDVSLKGYTKEFMQSLKRLASMIYKSSNDTSKQKYMPPSIKNNDGFSPRMNNTLNQMKRNY